MERGRRNLASRPSLQTPRAAAVVVEVMDIELEHVPCPLCRDDNPVPVITGRDVLCGVPGSFHIVRCSSCHHFYLNPRPNEATIGACYPSDYGPYKTPEVTDVGGTESGHADQSPEPIEPSPAPWYLSKWFRMIPGPRWLYYWLTDFKTDYIPPGTPGRALDVGCAGGNFLTKLRENGWRAEGVELMSEPANVARSRGFEVSEGTLEEAAFPEETFDAVFASMVFEHLHEPRTTMQEVDRVLKPGGWFVLTVPNFACWERYVFGGYWRGLELPRHLQHYTPRLLRGLLGEHGFDRIRVVHQRNLNNIIATIGLWLRERSWGAKLGQRMIDFTDEPGMWWQLVLAIPAKVLAFFRQGGRLTVIARKVG